MNPIAPGLVIIIDARPGYHPETCLRIHEFCENEPSIRAVALASYSFQSGELKRPISVNDQPWYSNTEKIFHWTSRIPLIEDWWSGLNRVDYSMTDPKISGIKLRSDQQGFFLLDPMQLLYYCNSVDPSIQNFWFFGGAWESCVKTRPVGWYQLAAMARSDMFKTDKYFYTRKDCVTGLDWCSSVDISDPWNLVNNLTYQLDFDKVSWDYETVI